MSDDKFDIEAILRRAEAATPGPWKAYHCQYSAVSADYWAWAVDAPEKRDDADAICSLADCPEDTEEHNAQFIAHARQDVPALCAEVTRLQAALAQAEAELAEFRSGKRYVGNTEHRTPTDFAHDTVRMLAMILHGTTTIPGVDLVGEFDWAGELKSKLAQLTAATERALRAETELADLRWRMRCLEK